MCVHTIGSMATILALLFVSHVVGFVLGTTRTFVRLPMEFPGYRQIIVDNPTQFLTAVWLSDN
jgi:hypothetical protein